MKMSSFYRIARGSMAAFLLYFLEWLCMLLRNPDDEVRTVKTVFRVSVNISLVSVLGWATLFYCGTP